MRYFLTNLIKKHVKGSFPLATFFLNVSGALVLGFVVGIKLKTLPYAILGTGFLGGYTTVTTELFALLLTFSAATVAILGVYPLIVGDLTSVKVELLFAAVHVP
ncbi:hypothetical protein GCM10010400_77750 [Streptomyces aculeolatus]